MTNKPLSAREQIEAMAARQEAFAGPEYAQNTDADRAMFRHAAKMLRTAALLAPGPAEPTPDPAPETPQ